MKEKKKIIIGVLCTLVCIMAVGYAVLAQQLNITGTTSIDSTWKVEITNIGEKEVVGNATSKVTPSYTATTADFNVGLTQPGDSITYDIEISNLGTLNAVLESINVTMDENEAIKYTTSGLKRGDKLGAGEKTTLTIKVEYDSSVTSQPSVTTKDITVTLNYQQDLGQVSTVYDEYAVGDTITFGGSNWYVIKNSTAEEDYVTLMKETVLTNAELGDYGIDYRCTADNVTNGTYGCTTEGEIKEWDIMSYYWSDTCHLYGDYGYGYTSFDTSGCEGHEDYEGSKVKEMLDNRYLPTLGADNLKEVDGYKIRLITVEELRNNLGWKNASDTSGSFATDSGNNVPLWVYQDFGENSNNNLDGGWSILNGYWTMTVQPSWPGGVVNVWRSNIEQGASGALNQYDGTMVINKFGVRPVINLLKSNI